MVALISAAVETVIGLVSVAPVLQVRLPLSPT